MTMDEWFHISVQAYLLYTIQCAVTGYDQNKVDRWIVVWAPNTELIEGIEKGRNDWLEFKTRINALFPCIL